MSDLISRSELIKLFKEHMRTARDFREIIINIIPTIKNQPTAYDIDKVIAKLEEAKHTICLSDDDLEHYQNGIDRSIEIVKQGCVASDDVCEWKYINDFELVSENHESKCIEGYDYKYCPYCGKKIKIGGKNDD